MDLTQFFLKNDQSIYSHAYKDVKYQENEDKNEYEYKANRLEQIIKIFQNKEYADEALPILTIMSLSTMKSKYNIETIDDLVFSYLMPKGLST